MLKSDLRKAYLEKRKALSSEQRARMSELIANMFFNSFDLSQTKFLHAFLAIEKFNEVDTTPIFQRLWSEFRQIQTVVPRVDVESKEIANLKFTSRTQLVKSAWGIPEPAHDEFVGAESIDMVLVPGLCFDPSGHRVGYGKGFYDRLLKRCRPDCVKIGLSYFEPVAKIDDLHDGDVRLYAVVTPDQLFELRNAERGVRNS